MGNVLQVLCLGILVEAQEMSRAEEMENDEVEDLETVVAVDGGLLHGGCGLNRESQSATTAKLNVNYQGKTHRKAIPLFYKMICQKIVIHILAVVNRKYMERFTGGQVNKGYTIS